MGTRKKKDASTSVAPKATPTRTAAKRRSPRPRRTALQLTPSHALIAAEAFHIWEQSGRPQGQELDHWLAAEQKLSA